MGSRFATGPTARCDLVPLARLRRICRDAGDNGLGGPWHGFARIGYIFGLAGNAVLLRRVSHLAEDAALGRIDGDAEKVRRYGELRYAATSWKVERRVIARVEAGPRVPTAALSSPICRACPRRSTRRSTARGARPKT